MRSSSVGVRLMGENSIVSIKGETEGTGFYISESVILTAYHVVGEARSLEINGQLYKREQILLDSNANKKYAIILMEDKVDDYFELSSDPMSIYDKYVYFSSSSDNTESGIVEFDGDRVRRNDRLLEYKFKDSQIKHGFSGSPVCNITNLSVCGFINTSRDVYQNLGAVTVAISSIYDELSAILGHGALREPVNNSTGKSWINKSEIEELVPSPFKNHKLFPQDSNVDKINQIIHAYNSITIIGSPGSGKRYLATQWLYSRKNFEEKNRAFILLNNAAGAEFPILNRLLRVLNIKKEKKYAGLGEHTLESRAAFARDSIRDALNSTTLVLSHTTKPSTEYLRDFRALINSETFIGSYVLFTTDDEALKGECNEENTFPIPNFSMSQAIDIIRLKIDHQSADFHLIQSKLSKLYPDGIPAHIFWGLMTQELRTLESIQAWLNEEIQGVFEHTSNLEQFDRLENLTEEDLYKLTINDILGPLIPKNQITTNPYLRWIGSMRRASDLRSIKLVSRMIPTVPISDLAMIQDIQGLLRDADQHYDFPREVEDSRTKFLSSVDTDIMDNATVAWLLADSCRARLIHGRTNDVAKVFEVFKDFNAKCDDLELNAMFTAIQSLVLKQDDTIKLVDELRKLNLRKNGNRSAILISIRFINLHIGLGLTFPNLYLIEEFITETYKTFKWENVEEIGFITISISTLSSLYDKRESRFELASRLNEFVKLLSLHESELRYLALAGDNRPILTLARQQRRLSRVYFLLGVPSAASMLRSATRSFEWITQNSPTPAAWFSRLKFIFGEESLGSESETPITSKRFREIKTEYENSVAVDHKNGRTIEISYLFLRIGWKLDGDIFALAVKKSNLSSKLRQRQQIERHIHGIYSYRHKQIDLIRNEFGDSTHDVMALVRLEDSKAEAVALNLGSDTDYSIGDEIIADGLANFSFDGPLLELACRRLRKRRELFKAISLYEILFEGMGSDKLLRARSGISFAETLIQVSLSSKTPNVEFARKAVDILEPLVLTSSEASMHWLRAQAELNEGKLPKEVLILRDIFANRNGYNWIAGNHLQYFYDELYSDDVSIMNHCLKLIVSDFTSPELLNNFGSFLSRSARLSQENWKITLEAALNCLDGARVMNLDRSTRKMNDFHIGVALLYGCRYLGTTDGIGWAKKYRSEYADDEALGMKLISDVTSRSHGSFKAMCSKFLRNSDQLAPNEW